MEVVVGMIGTEEVKLLEVQAASPTCDAGEAA